ncbi:hypothetical protein HDU76_002766 [Blyttiomyces sp. JEL0837]|nr:hypothetical protein HDU76_002766 [Blyttiomyces sp. JEL0837]
MVNVESGDVAHDHDGGRADQPAATTKRRITPADYMIRYSGRLTASPTPGSARSTDRSNSARSPTGEQPQAETQHIVGEQLLPAVIERVVKSASQPSATSPPQVRKLEAPPTKEADNNFVHRAGSPSHRPPNPIKQTSSSSPSTSRAPASKPNQGVPGQNSHAHTSSPGRPKSPPATSSSKSANSAESSTSNYKTTIKSNGSKGSSTHSASVSKSVGRTSPPSTDRVKHSTHPKPMSTNSTPTQVKVYGQEVKKVPSSSLNITPKVARRDSKIEPIPATPKQAHPPNTQQFTTSHHVARSTGNGSTNPSTSRQTDDNIPPPPLPPPPMPKSAPEPKVPPFMIKLRKDLSDQRDLQQSLNAEYIRNKQFYNAVVNEMGEGKVHLEAPPKLPVYQGGFNETDLEVFEMISELDIDFIRNAMNAGNREYADKVASWRRQCYSWRASVTAQLKRWREAQWSATASSTNSGTKKRGHDEADNHYTDRWSSSKRRGSDDSHPGRQMETDVSFDRSRY